MLEVTTKELLTQLFQHALDMVDGRRVVFDWCAKSDQAFKYCIAIGKASPAMMQGALDSQKSIQQGLVVCPQGSVPRALKKNSRLSIVESSHPLPDQSSLDAGNHLLRFISHIPDDEPILFLISGGASSLIEVLKDDFTLQQLQEVNQYLLSSGKNIQQINYWRKCISKIKGGGLLGYLKGKHCTQLLISDVKNNDISVIGSALLVRAEGDFSDEDSWLSCLKIDTDGVDEIHDSVETHVIATLQSALADIKEQGEQYGIDCYLHDEFIDGDARERGQALGKWLVDAPCGLHIWGAETTVTLPERPGLGGRNQHFLLSCVEAIANKNISVLSAGTDGIDGATTCAGGFVSGFTYKTIRQMGFDIDDELNRANSGNVLMAADCLLMTGRTNTNVMDVILAYKSGMTRLHK